MKFKASKNTFKIIKKREFKVKVMKKKKKALNNKNKRMK